LVVLPSSLMCPGTLPDQERKIHLTHLFRFVGPPLSYVGLLFEQLPRQSTKFRIVPSILQNAVSHSWERGRDRAANSAIHIIITIRQLSLDPRTKVYVARRIASGTSRLVAT